MTEVVKYKAKRSDSALTPEIRWAYPYLHEKSTTRPNGKPRAVPVWIVTGLMPKLNPDPAQCANYQFLLRLIMEAASREPAWGGQFPQGGHLPIQDGDAPPKPKIGLPGQPAAAVDPNKGAWRKGHWCFEATTSLDPGPRVCVMQNGQAIEIPAKTVNGRTMYKSGDFGHGSIHAYSFWNEKYGFSYGLEGMLWTREGEAIGSQGPRSAASMFGAVAQVGGAAPMAAPQPQYAPAPAYGQPAPIAPQYAPQPGPAPTMAPPPASPAPQYAAPPVAPVVPYHDNGTPNPAYQPATGAPVAPPPGVPAAPSYAPPMPPVAPVASPPGLPPFPGR